MATNECVEDQDPIERFERGQVAAHRVIKRFANGLFFILRLALTDFLGLCGFVFVK